jgi:hypothetical protein
MGHLQSCHFSKPHKKNNNRVFSETETEHEMSQTLELWGLCINRKQKTHIYIYINKKRLIFYKNKP